MENASTAGLLAPETYSLTLDQLALACSVQVEWLVARIDADLICTSPASVAAGRFDGADRVRVQRLVGMEHMFDATPEAAALMVDLIEEVESLRRQLRLAQVAGGKWSGPDPV
jgi:chaperone modulatory protein CbpM